MRTRLLRSVCALILAVCAVGASASVAQAAASMEHACCHRAAPADSLTVPEAPCNGFLPLTCCHAAALPGGDHASLQAPAELASVAFTAIQTTPPAVIARFDDAALVPRVAATRLTVVRQL